MVKGKVKLSTKIRFKVNKGHGRLKVENSSNHWPKDHSNENSSLGTLDIDSVNKMTC